ncbi:argininosuccinate lyase [Vulcanimicrobium alpinum]|uniref:argininosuccinate lyase n=1 Tax=Vulcanimicrobium alpinum TaxID=3016050 RepID=UPI00295E54B2|nr:argininosuccinate lyase [Vulcanimicrobium alpinum]
MSTLQWGGRFASAPDAELLAFGSSLDVDLGIARWDVQCSHGHVVALHSGEIIGDADAEALHDALAAVEAEIDDGSFDAWAKRGTFEDVHGAVDARVREHAGKTGELLHAGRSRNDQVATTLLLYARDTAANGALACLDVAALCADRAADALAKQTLFAATTHWQPAQPVLLALWIDAVAQGFVRAAERFARVAADARRFCPLGSAALAGSSLPLDRAAAAQALGFDGPSHNALDSVGDRDVPLDLLHAAARAAVAASRPSEELVIWATPAFGYIRLDDAASTGSSLMPQKRNPDPFELVRGFGARAIGAYAGALATVNGMALSYHRDLQETKAQVLAGVPPALAAVDAFRRAFAHVHFRHDTMNARAGDGYTVATDLADAVILAGATAREAHRAVGERVLLAEDHGRPLDRDDAVALGVPDAAVDARGSVLGKRTAGSTHPDSVAAAIARTRHAIAALSETLS